MNMESPNVPRHTNQLSHRERFRKYASEVRYAISLVVNRLKEMQAERSPSDEQHSVKLFVGLSTQTKERSVFAHALHVHGLTWINVVSGRVVLFDLDSPQDRTVVQILDSDRWAADERELSQLLHRFCILLDGWYNATAVQGQHAKKCMHVRINETKLKQTISDVTLKYGSEQNG